MKKLLIIAQIMLALTVSAQAQTKKSIAILYFDTKGILQDSKSMSSLIRFEIEKTEKYNVYDKYDMEYQSKKQNIDLEGCFGTSCLLDVGKSLGTDYVIGGSVERFGEKIVVELRLINVEKGYVENSNIKEYANLQPYIQKMAMLSVQNLLDIEVDPLLAQQLYFLEKPIINHAARLNASGPRVGAAFITKGSSDYDTQFILDSLNKYNIMTQIGYQVEKQYLSTGNFQALFEFIFTISGMDQGMFIPSVSMLNGFRSSKTGWEIAFGPNVSVSKVVDVKEKADGIGGTYEKVYIETKLKSSWTWAVGKTFRSGNLNIPINLYVSPNKEQGWYVGASLGFNMTSNKK